MVKNDEDLDCLKICCFNKNKEMLYTLLENIKNLYS